jgi:hypothetical protein
MILLILAWWLFGFISTVGLIIWDERELTLTMAAASIVIGWLGPLPLIFFILHHYGNVVILKLRPKERGK